MIYHPDHSVEPLRKPLLEMKPAKGGPQKSFIYPGKELPEELRALANPDSEPEAEAEPEVIEGEVLPPR